MDKSILYGLRNPAMTDDIGMSMIERQFPTTIDNMSYGFADGTAPQINNGHPKSDVYQNKREKEYSIMKKILIVIGAVGLGILGYKKGVKLIKNTYSYVAESIKNVFGKNKNVFSNLINKIKLKKVSP